MKQFFMKILPKTLWGQLVSLLLLALIVSQLVALAIFVDSRRIANNSVAEARMIDRIVGLVNSVEFKGNRIWPNRRIFDKANTRDLQFRGALKPLHGRDDHPPHSARLHQLLSERLPDIKQIIVTSEGSRGMMGGAFGRTNQPKTIRISIKLTPKYWLNVKRFDRPPSYTWIAPLLLTMILMMLFIVLIVSWVVRRLTKPLAALADGAKNLGYGRDVDELPEMGSEDVRNVTRSFNIMNKKIKRFVDDRTKMLAAISHDLRTPITSLRLRAEFIEDKEMQRKILETLEEMQMMTEAALKFSTDSSAYEKTKNIDLESLLDILVDDYKDMGKKIKLVANEKRSQIILPLRVQSIRRALRNLIENGLNYGQKVTIDYMQSTDKKNVEIYIRDIGKGIDEAEFEQVFEPFYRLETSRNKDTGGVGLGLSIARNIIRAHGGDVTVQNIKQDGEIKGLEVKVILPL